MRLKEARAKLGIKQTELAEALGISPAYLSLMETERQIVSEPVALKRQEKYNIDAEWLLYGKVPVEESSRRLKSVRKEFGLTQKEMGEALMISSAYVGLMERGEQPISISVALRLQDICLISSEWLLYGKGNKYV